jgi:putative ubiquitin-RnfH superfamily antitoxin RatB of RatAB toxin-antitoxin module
MEPPIATDEGLMIEVVFAQPDRQVIIPLQVKLGTTAMDAFRLSCMAEHFPEIDRNNPVLGIFGVVCRHDKVLQEGDRVEIYRPLSQDPKESRRQRALKK